MCRYIDKGFEFIGSRAFNGTILKIHLVMCVYPVIKREMVSTKLPIFVLSVVAGERAGTTPQAVEAS